MNAALRVVHMGSQGGRPRGTGERYPSGDLKPKRPGGEPISPALWQRMKAQWTKIFNDAGHGSEVGRLSFDGELTNAQTAAAFRIGEIYRKYHRFKQLRDTAKSPSYQQGFGGSSDLAEERMTAEQLAAFEGNIRKAEADWAKVDGALAAAHIPRPLRQAIIDICVFDTPTNPLFYPAIRYFLDQMVLRWAERFDDIDKRINMNGRRMGIPNRPVIERVVPAKPKRPDTITPTFEAVVRKLRPDLDDKGIRLATETFTAMRDRAVYRLAKKPR